MSQALATAYKKGVRARKEGVQMKDNPYRKGDENYWNWLSGHMFYKLGDNNGT